MLNIFRKKICWELSLTYFVTYFSISNLPKWSRASIKSTDDSFGDKKKGAFAVSTGLSVWFFFESSAETRPLTTCELLYATPFFPIVTLLWLHRGYFFSYQLSPMIPFSHSYHVSSTATILWYHYEVVLIFRLSPLVCDKVFPARPHVAITIIPPAWFSPSGSLIRDPFFSNLAILVVFTCWSLCLFVSYPTPISLLFYPRMWIYCRNTSLARNIFSNTSPDSLRCFNTTLRLINFHVRPLLYYICILRPGICLVIVLRP